MHWIGKWCGMSLVAATAVLSPLQSCKAFADPDLIGGTPADPDEWPASVYASMSGASCSSTLIGEKVLLIAAHCVTNGGNASFTVGPNRYTARCTHGPDYVRDSTADWALCLVERAVDQIPFENLNTDPSVCVVGAKLMLTGYGCVRAGGGGGNDGVYRIGEAAIQSCPTNATNDIVTRGGAALCYGDSGGPAFLVTGQTRKLVSVNSRGDIRTTSYLSSVSTPKAKAFIADWKRVNGVKICGVDGDAVRCRGANEPDPDPASCGNELEDALHKQGQAGAALDELSACLSR